MTLAKKTAEELFKEYADFIVGYGREELTILSVRRYAMRRFQIEGKEFWKNVESELHKNKESWSHQYLFNS